MNRLVVAALVRTCTALDRLPAYRRTEIPARSLRHWGWYRHGLLGCQLGLAGWSANLDERWRTGVWKETTDDR